MMLNQSFEVDVKVRQDSRQKSHVRREVDLDLSTGELREEIAPAAVSEKKHDSLCSVSASHLQEHYQSEILMVSVGTILSIGLRPGFQNSRQELA
jgi:hypothetical protein